MTHASKAIVGVMLTVLLVIVSLFFVASPAQPAESEQATEGCVINVLGIKVCGTLLNQPLPEVVTVTAPPVTLPPATVTLPGQTHTVTIRPDPVRVTETITPAPVRVTETVTAPSQPQATATATVTERVPQATATTTIRPNGQPVPTATETVTIVEQVTRQPDPDSGTIEPEQDDPFLSPDIDFGDSEVSAGEAGIGLLGALLLLALVMGGMWYGFHRGRRSEESIESDFLRTLLDRTKTE